MSLANRITIDNQDLWTTWHAFVKDQGLNSLLSFAPCRTPYYNDWAEYDGIEPELISLKLDARTLTVQVYTTSADDADSLIRYLVGHPQSVWRYTTASMWTLRFTGVQTMTYLSSELWCLQLSLVEERPNLGRLSSISYLSPTISNVPIGGVPLQGLEIDGHDLSHYGLWLTQGSMQSLLKPAAVKPNLRYTITTDAGTYYDTDTLQHRASRDITLNLHTSAESTSRMLAFKAAYKRCQDLITKLTASSIKAMKLDGELDNAGNPLTRYVFYKSATVNKTLITDNVAWIDFSLTLTEAYTSQTPPAIILTGLVDGYSYQLTALVNSVSYTLTT